MHVKTPWNYDKSETGNTVARQLSQPSTFMVIRNDGPSNINCEAGVARFTDIAPRASICLVITNQDVRIFTPHGPASGVVEMDPPRPVTGAWSYAQSTNGHNIYRSLDEKPAVLVIKNNGPGKINCEAGVAKFSDIAPLAGVPLDVTNQDVRIITPNGPSSGEFEIK